MFLFCRSVRYVQRARSPLQCENCLSDNLYGVIDPAQLMLKMQQASPHMSAADVNVNLVNKFKVDMTRNKIAATAIKTLEYASRDG